MIRTLVDYDRITAAGILARMALALDDEGNPASKSLIPNENLIRQKVLSELKDRLGLLPDDESEETIERVSEELDAESDSLVGLIDIDQTLSKLSQVGRLPSDLYYTQISDTIEKFYGEKFSEERSNIEQTINSPDREEHFGGKEESKGRLFSLFTKHFPHEFAFKSFTLLIMGQRHGTILVVNHVWRVYPDRVNLEGAKNLTDVLRRFADAFGLIIEVDGKRGKFIVAKEAFEGESFETTFRVVPTYKPDKRGKMREIGAHYELTIFSLLTDVHAETAFLAIDLNRYRKNLEAHGW